MLISKNNTSATIGSATATVICDSVADGNRIVTLEMLYPRYIHSELMTHRQFSRNASSSRATPIKVLVSEARSPVFFDEVYKNKPGMQGTEQLSVEELECFQTKWTELANYVADWVESMSKDLNIHKQHLNRVLEPFSPIRTLVTATEFDNFFKLRIDSAAQPEIRNLALAMRQAMDSSTPKETISHLPYIDFEADLDTQRQVSVARCARVSYGRLDGRKDNVEDDIRLYHQLLEAGHLSPFEHVATASAGRHANFTGWCSLRCNMGL